FTDKFKQQYCEYLAGLQARGVAMSIGSDTHSASEVFDMAEVQKILEKSGINCDKFWCLPDQYREQENEVTREIS
ncbi:MAG: hypothetical protein JXA11_14700, partial [Phycisphaerae bacterium]|nr:hypothetical protein [Phycisphaerae bacterium]